MTDLLTKLEEWNHGHKARSVSIHIDNGYGSTSWSVDMHGNGPSISVWESVDCGDRTPSDGTIAGHPYVKAQDGSLGFEITGPKRGEWAGLKATLAAALAIAEEMKL